jgi:hypothetical protein
MHQSFRTALFAIPLAGAIVSCSSASNEKELQYTVEFPSKSAAVATDAIQVFAFSGSQECVSLIKGYGPPAVWAQAPFAQTASASPCALPALSLPFGAYTFLVVGSKEGRELLIGCALQTLDGSTEPLKVPLSLFALDRTIPQTTCNLTDKCAGRSCQ